MYQTTDCTQNEDIYVDINIVIYLIICVLKKYKRRTKGK